MSSESWKNFMKKFLLSVCPGFFPGFNWQNTYAALWTLAKAPRGVMAFMVASVVFACNVADNYLSDKFENWFCCISKKKGSVARKVTMLS